MAKTKHKTDAEILDHYKIALTNAVNQTELATTLAEFGYDTDTIAQGSDLLAETTAAFNANKQEDNETIAARADFDAKKAALKETYSLHRKKGKVVFRKDEVALKQLGLTGSLPQNHIKWIETLKTFYSGVQANANYQTKLVQLKVTADDITASLTAIAAMEDARALYLKEVGESQDATKAKDAAFAKIDDWMRDFFAVAKIAMEDKPQLLEALGLYIRS